MASFWGELRRRNVLKVAVAYAVVAWLLAQIADLVLSAFELPSWVLQTFLAVAALGFPVVIILTWIYVLTPEGVKRTDDVFEPDAVTQLTGRKLGFAFAGIAVVTVGFFVVANYMRPAEEPKSLPNSIAVLDFINRGVSSDDEYLANGLADELRSTLAKIVELSVASGLSSSYYKGKATDMRIIAETLNVDNVLNGSVQRDGERISVTVELIDGESGYQVWSESYDRAAEDFLAIQVEIARSVASEIAPVLLSSSEEQVDTSPTQNLEA